MERQALQRIVRRLAWRVLDFVLPGECFCCGAALTGRALHSACPACWSRFEILRPPLCRTCALPLDGGDLERPGSTRCRRCTRRPPPFARAVACVAYDDRARAFVLRAKEADRPELFWALGAQLLGLLRHQRMLGSWDAVFPIPSHPWSRLRRGFEPAAELARPLGQAGLRVIPRALRRRWRPWSSAKGMTAWERRQALWAAFELRQAVTRARILLVDDVMTTGASAEACARLLRARGARAVGVAVWARTLPGAERVGSPGLPATGSPPIIPRSARRANLDGLTR